MPNTRKRTVLLVDDSSLVGAKVLELLSTIPGLELLQQARTVKEGLQLCEENSPGIVILDINLPDGSGIDLLEKLKSRQYPGRVIMLTNNSNEFYRKKCLQLQAAYFLDKTHDFSRIPEIISELIG